MAKSKHAAARWVWEDAIYIVSAIYATNTTFPVQFVQIELFGTCLMPKTFNDMIKCEEWFHLKCMGVTHTGGLPIVYGCNGIPFITSVRTQYRQLNKRSPYARGQVCTDHRTLYVYLPLSVSSKMVRRITQSLDSRHSSVTSGSFARENASPQPKRRRCEMIFCSHCVRSGPKVYLLSPLSGFFTTE